MFNSVYIRGFLIRNGFLKEAVITIPKSKLKYVNDLSNYKDHTPSTIIGKLLSSIILCKYKSTLDIPDVQLG